MGHYEGLHSLLKMLLNGTSIGHFHYYLEVYEYMTKFSTNSPRFRCPHVFIS